MRYTLIILSLLLCLGASAQVYQSMPQAGYGPVKRMLVDSVLTIPIGISQLRNITGGRDTAQIRYQKSDSSVYVYTGSTWVKLGSGGGGGGSVDSTVFFTVYRADTMRANIYAAIPGVDTFYTRYPVRVSNDTIYLAQTFVDSVYNVSSADATRLITNVYNNTGSTIPKGSVVYINGRHSSNLPTVALAQANDEANSYKTFALVQDDIATSSSGVAIQAGRINNLNLPTSSYTDGDLLYLSPTVAGGYTTTKPLAPFHICKIGSVTRAHPTLGAIEIKIENGWELAEMSDVQIAAVPADSAVLQFSRDDSLWHDVSPSTALGDRAWRTGGNGSVNSNYFIGSTNNATVRFRTNNVERMTIDSVGTVLISSEDTRTAAQALYKFAGVNTLKPTVNSPSDYRVMYFSNEVNAPAINFTNIMQAGYFENRIFNAGTINYATGFQSIGTRIGSAGATLTGITQTDGITATPVADISSSTSATISTARGVRVVNSEKNTSLTITNQVGLQVDANFNSGTNNTDILLGTNTAPTGNYSIYSANTNSSYFAGNIGIGVTSPSSTAALDITSTTRGLLIPRMSTSNRNAISSPASQLIVANTTDKTIDMYNGTSWNTIGGGYSDDLKALQLMGATIKTTAIGQPLLPVTGSAMTASRSYFSSVYLPREATITGASWYQSTQGVYVGTGGGYNGIGLYRDSSGTLILVDSTTRDTTIWKAASNTWNTKAFAGGTRTLQPGVYYLCAVVNTVSSTFPAGQTAPAIGNWSGPSGNSGTLTLLSNSRKIYGGVQTGVTALPTSQAMTAWNNLTNFYYSLYLY